MGIAQTVAPKGEVPEFYQSGTHYKLCNTNLQACVAPCKDQQAQGIGDWKWWNLPKRLWLTSIIPYSSVINAVCNLATLKTIQDRYFGDFWSNHSLNEHLRLEWWFQACEGSEVLLVNKSEGTQFLIRDVRTEARADLFPKKGRASKQISESIKSTCVTWGTCFCICFPQGQHASHHFGVGIESWDVHSDQGLWKLQRCLRSWVVSWPKSHYETFVGRPSRQVFGSNFSQGIPPWCLRSAKLRCRTSTCPFHLCPMVGWSPESQNGRRLAASPICLSPPFGPKR